MKSLITLILATAIISGQALAQSGNLSADAYSARIGTPRTVKWIPIAYLGLGNLRLQGPSDSASYHKVPGTSYGIGLLADFNSGSSLSVLSGLRYLKQAGKLQRDYASSSLATLDLSIETVGIPLLLKYKTSHSVNRFTFVGGVEPVYAFGAEIEAKVRATDSKGKSFEKTYSNRDKDGLRALNAIAVAGIGIESTVANGNSILAELTYNRMLLPFNQDDEKNQNYLESFLFSVGLGL